MEFLFPEGQHFECVEGCARCCTAGWQVVVEPPVQAVVRKSYLALEVLQETHRPAMRVERDQTVLANRNDRCVMLDQDLLCRLHSRFGVHAKPRPCRGFPFILQPTPDGVVAGLSFYCPAVQRNQGRPVSEFAPELEELVTGSTPLTLGPVKVWNETALNWPEYRELEKWLQEQPDLSQALATALLALGDWSVGSVPWREALARDLRPPERDLVGWLRWSVAAGLISVLEWSDHPDFWTNFGRLTEGSEVVIPSLGMSFSRGQAGSPPAEPLERFMRHLVHRKALLDGENLMAGLLMLLGLPEVLAFYSSARDDFWWAVERVEYHLVGHSQRGNAFCRSFVDSMLAGWQSLHPLARAS
ncbi:MAG: YkgJ family cysteine cluster protein [Candidatus Eremiobacteraeota bacterium]|nr:YkgJ family cysteine cluster protein [Candidatus Eremiobacteraeota bacterium]